MSAPFKRSTRSRSGQPRMDETGTVQVRVILLGPSKNAAQKGNVTKALSVSDAKVSEVFAAIERALFGETP